MVQIKNMQVDADINGLRGYALQLMISFSVWSYDMLLSFCLELVLRGIFMGNSSQVSISQQKIISGQWIKVYLSCLELHLCSQNLKVFF